MRIPLLLLVALAASPLAGGLAPENVAAAIAAVRPWAVDASSSLEVSPGVKDHARVRAYVEDVIRQARLRYGLNVAVPDGIRVIDGYQGSGRAEVQPEELRTGAGWGRPSSAP